jgi:hypothetical protein
MAIEPTVLSDAATEPALDPAEPIEPSRSRRSVIGAGLAGLAGLVLGSLGRPTQAGAASGGSLVMGASNSAGTSNTSLTTDSTGTALLVTQTGAGTALRGSATAVSGIAGFFTSANGPGVSGVTANIVRTPGPTPIASLSRKTSQPLSAASTSTRPSTASLPPRGSMRSAVPR